MLVHILDSYAFAYTLPGAGQEGDYFLMTTTQLCAVRIYDKYNLTSGHLHNSNSTVLLKCCPVTGR